VFECGVFVCGCCVWVCVCVCVLAVCGLFSAGERAILDAPKKNILPLSYNCIFARGSGVQDTSANFYGIVFYCVTHHDLGHRLDFFVFEGCGSLQCSE
jgi:hypothetical protein